MDRIYEKRQQVAAALRELAEGSPDERLCVGKVMTRHPITISIDATVLDLVQLFHAREFRHPLVTDGEGRLAGVVSDRDVIRCFGPDKYPEEAVLKSITAGQIMSTDLVTTSPEASLESAVDLLFGYGINCLPVVSEGKLVGILTTTDLYLVLEALLAHLGRSPEGRLAETAARLA